MGNENSKVHEAAGAVGAVGKDQKMYAVNCNARPGQTLTGQRLNNNPYVKKLWIVKDESYLIYEYQINVVTEGQCDIIFMDETHDIYNLWCARDGSHYVNYNSEKPNIVGFMVRPSGYKAPVGPSPHAKGMIKVGAVNPFNNHGDSNDPGTAVRNIQARCEWCFYYLALYMHGGSELAQQFQQFCSAEGSPLDPPSDNQVYQWIWEHLGLRNRDFTSLGNLITSALGRMFIDEIEQPWLAPLTAAMVTLGWTNVFLREESMKFPPSHFSGRRLDNWFRSHEHTRDQWIEATWGVMGGLSLEIVEDFIALGAAAFIVPEMLAVITEAFGEAFAEIFSGALNGGSKAGFLG